MAIEKKAEAKKKGPKSQAQAKANPEVLESKQPVEPDHAKDSPIVGIFILEQNGGSQACLIT